MTLLHDYRSDFGRGRTGPGLRARPEAEAYRASMKDARNMMVTAEHDLERRWGLKIVDALTVEARLETWEFDTGDTSTFILIFENAKLTILDLTLATRATLTSQPWTDETMHFMSFTSERNRVILSDATFQPRVLTFDPDAATFSIALHELETSSDGTRLRAPFFQFADDSIVFDLTIFTSAGASTGYGTHIATAGGFGGGTYDLALGTGTITASEDYFDALHVGTRMRFLDGELEITAVTDAQNASVKVWRDIARKLDPNPFWLRKSSKIVEVGVANHGLSVGDDVYFVGMSRTDEAVLLLDRTVKHATNLTTVVAPTQTAAAYTVKRVIDDGHFEILGEGTDPTADALAGGGDVLMFPLSGISKPKEPAFSALRGWPQACVMHERRLWLGGTASLPDAAWASTFFNIHDFDPGDGGPDDALVLYGIGNQARVRHFVSSTDLLILTDKGLFFVPSPQDVALTQELARVLSGPAVGASYTRPVRFDRAVYFVDRDGTHVREARGDGREYVTTPATVVTADWVDDPFHVALYRGSPDEGMPYAIFTNADGSALVMHSDTENRAFGFMRWDLENGVFLSFAGARRRLFAVARRGAEYWLCEFDTSPRAGRASMDFCETLTNGSPTTSWTADFIVSRTVQLESEGRVYSDVTIDANGDFTTPEAVDILHVGDAMPWDFTLHPAIAATGQGLKTGKMQRLVSAEIEWIETETGDVEGQNALSALDNPALEAPTPINEWRRYTIGKWGREPTMTVSGDTPGHVGVRAVALNVYV